MKEIQSNEIIKVTALVYFQEALSTQDYESCPQLIGMAKQLGASQDEITAVISSHLRGDKPGGKNATSTVRNRLGALKEK